MRVYLSGLCPKVLRTSESQSSKKGPKGPKEDPKVPTAAWTGDDFPSFSVWEDGNMMEHVDLDSNYHPVSSNMACWKPWTIGDVSSYFNLH